jgi:hypothetical protein
VEPKETLNTAKLKNISNRTDDEMDGVVQSSVKPKTNTWWTRAEYQKFHDNIEEYRERKRLERMKEKSGKENDFRPVGAAFAVRKYPCCRSKSNGESGKKDIDKSDLRRPIWQERLMGNVSQSSSTKGGMGSLFVKSSVFQQHAFDGRLSRQSQASTIDSLHFSYKLTNKPAVTETFMKKLQNGLVEVSFI